MMADIQMTRHDALSFLRQEIAPTAKLVADTRQITTGDVYLAYAVGHGKALRDGRLYIQKALEQGASYVLYAPQKDYEEAADWESDLDERCFAVENLATDAGWIVSEWYGNPSQNMKVIGVTGTNGKTSVTQWLAQTLPEKTAVIGTLGSGFPNQLQNLGYTTPDAPRLQNELAQFKNQGAAYVALEVSSHALEQGRVNGTYFDCAAFTNLSRDHLDYHGNMAEYGAAKAKLFKEFQLKHAVVNIEDSFGRELFMDLLARKSMTVWAYGLNKASFQSLENLQDRFNAIYFDELSFEKNTYQCKVRIAGKQYEVRIPVVGLFNLSNALAVLSTLIATGIGISDALSKMSSLTPVKGRMEIINVNQINAPLMIVDYAHTPDALEKVLETLKPIAHQRQGKIICVFGCGGDRDSEKRPIMGSIAQSHADHLIITSDNPRFEDPHKIIAMIESGIDHSIHSPIERIVDRASAILTAVKLAKKNDIVLVAGKGHETTQEIQGKRFEFSDQMHLRLACGGSV